MSTNRTEEDWFLRGGERPKNSNEQTQTPVVTCKNCGDDDDGELRLYVVEVSQTKTVTQTARVQVRAASECDAMVLVEEQAANGDLNVTDLDWIDVEDSDEYGDFTAEDAEEV